MRPFLIALLLSFCLTTSASAAAVRISAAASMTDAVEELIAGYRLAVPDASFLPNFASSGSLAKQIAQGAPADIFISAHPDWMDYLARQGRVRAETVRTLARNALVFVGWKNPAVATLHDLVRLEHIAIGSPRSVPAGRYAEQALRAAGLYERLADRLVMAKDVRHALVYADRGETDGAFVYRTDALLATEAVILLQVPRTLYDEVAYPVALTAEGGDKPAAVAFFAFLAGDEAAAILEKHGFVVR